MSVSDFGITRSMSQSSRESVIKVADTDMGSFISASADVLKDSQDGDSDEEEGNDKAFAQKYQQLVTTYVSNSDANESSRISSNNDKRMSENVINKSNSSNLTDHASNDSFPPSKSWVWWESCLIFH